MDHENAHSSLEILNNDLASEMENDEGHTTSVRSHINNTGISSSRWQYSTTQLCPRHCHDTAFTERLSKHEEWEG